MTTPVDTSSFNPQQLAAFNSANALGSGVQTTNSTPTPSNYVNPNAALQVPAAQTPSNPIPQNQTPASPTVNVNVASQPTSQPAQQAQPTSQTTQNLQVPTTSLQPGAQGQDVQQLQSYLVQMGYLTPEQVSTGAGVYGPQTTAAVAKLQQDLGVNPGTGSGYYGPQTQAALEQKYQNIFSQMSGSAPDQGGAARDAITAADMASSGADSPVMSAMSGSLAPIMQSLTQVLNNINNPALTSTSLQQEYNDLSSQYNLPAMQSQMMNLQNIMTGTTDDIRQEITTAGGSATESQVQAMSAARNNVIIKQYNALATQYTAAQTTVGNMMQYQQQDIQNANTKNQLTASVTESLASIENQMMQMGMTMQTNARDAVQYNVTQMGYQGLADSANGNQQVLSSYENILGLPPGSLSNPDTVAQMDTYKNQQLQLNNYKAAISAYQAGYGGNGTGGTGTTTTPPGQVGVTPVDPSTLQRPSWLPNNVPLTLSANQMEQYMSTNTAASVDGSTNNVVAPGIGYYVQQSDGSYVLNSALPSTTQTQYNQIQQTIQSAGQFSGSPTVTGKWTLAANRVSSAFKDTGTYKVASNVAPYLAAIHAAAQNPGDKSISDFELLDSFVKASKGGSGQVTDSQINTILQGASLSDSYATLEQKLQNGGVLSPAQRTSLVNLADQTYTENLADYQKGYVQTVQAMQGEGIPPQFWASLPDFTSLTPQ